MATLSVRFKDPYVYERLGRQAQGASLSSLAERLIDEGLRMATHARIVFRPGPTGRRAGLAAGPDVWEVISVVHDQEGSLEERMATTAQLLDLPLHWVQSAVGYYAEFTEEIDARIEANQRADRECFAAWERARDLLSR